MGMRVWEQLNADWKSFIPRHRKTPLYFPVGVAEKMSKMLGMTAHLEFMQQQGIVEIVRLGSNERFWLGDYSVTPVGLDADGSYGFLVESFAPKRRVLICPDETKDWDPPRDLAGVDLAILPMGIMERKDGESEVKGFPTGHPALSQACTYRETLEHCRQIGARRTYLTHIDEPNQYSYDDLKRLEREDLRFAFDTLVVEV